MALYGEDPYVPYMGSRVPLINSFPRLSTEPADGVPEFNISGNITYRFGKKQGSSHDPNPVIYLNTTAKLASETQGFIDHLPTLWMTTSFPTPDHTYANIAAMKAAANVTVHGDNCFVTATSEYYYCVSFGKSPTVYYWIKIYLFPASTGETFVSDGATYDVFEVDQPTSEMIAAYRDATNQPSASLIGGLYEACISGNRRHYDNTVNSTNREGNPLLQTTSFDTVFYLIPYEPVHYNTWPKRKEMMARTAGEKAWHEDEFVTLTQIEGGEGIEVRVRSSAGGLDGYSTELDKAYNVVIENKGIVSVRESTVIGYSLATGVAVAWDTGTLYTPINEVTFAREYDWLLDNAYARVGPGAPFQVWSAPESIPVILDVVESPIGKARVMARTLHNNVYVSHDTGTIAHYDNAPNGTVSHFQFKDSATVAFTLTEGAVATPGKGYRHGVVIEASILGGTTVTVAKEKVPTAVTESQSNANVGTLVYAAMSSVYFADSVWNVDHGLDAYSQYHPDVQWVQDNDGSVDRWRAKIPSRHLPINFYVRQGSAGQSVVSASVAAPGLYVGTNNLNGLGGAFSYVGRPSAGVNPGAMMEWQASSTWSSVSHTTNIIVEKKQYYPWCNDEGDAILVLEDVEQQPTGGTMSADDVVNAHLLRLDARTIGGSARMDRHYTPETQGNIPTLIGYTMTPDGLQVVTGNGQNTAYLELPKESVMWGKPLSGELNYTGTMLEPSQRYIDSENEIVTSTGAFRPGIYRVNVTVFGRSKMPVTAGQVTPGAILNMRGFSRLKLHLAEFRSRTDPPMQMPRGVTSPHPIYLQARPLTNWYSVGDILEHRDIHPVENVEASGEWCMQGDFLLPISDATMYPDGLYLNGAGFGTYSMWVEVEYPYGFRGAIDRTYFVRQCYIDLHFIEQHPRKPYNFRPRIT